MEGSLSASYRIDKRQKLVVTTASGILTLADILDHQQRLLKDKDFDPGFSQLINFNAVKKFAVSTRDVRRLAGKSIFSPDARRALVAEKSDLVFGFSRMFEIIRDLRGDHRIRVFRDREQALAWLCSKRAA
jgi:hypothetical protein